MIDHTKPPECFDDALPDGWSMRVTLDRGPDGQLAGRLVVAQGNSDKSIQVLTRLGTSEADAQARLRQRAIRWIEEYCSSRSVSGGGTG